MAELDNTRVCIRFSGMNLDPKKVGELLRFVESEITETTINILKNGRVVWVIRLNDNDNKALPIEEKIEALIAIFTDDITSWKQVTDIAKADIFCGLFMEGWNQGFELSPNLMRKMADRNLLIGFDIYSPTDSWYK